MRPVSRRVNKTGSGDDDPTFIDEGRGLMPAKGKETQAHREAISLEGPGFTRGAAVPA